MSGGAARSSAINGRRSLLAKPLGWSRNSGSAVSRAWLRRSPRAQPWDAGAGRGGDGCGDGVQGSGPGDRVVADSLDAEQAPVGGVADLPQRGQIRRSFPDPEIVGVGDDGLGARGIPLLLDCGVFVVHVQARGDPGGDHPGPGTVPVSREGRGGSDGGRRRDRPDRGGRCRGCRG